MNPDPRTLENLSAYLDGTLSPAERASIESLLARNAEARKALEGLKAVRAAVKELPPLAPPEAFYQRVLRDIEEKPARRPFLSFVPLKTVGAFAVMGLVVVATHDLWNPRGLRTPPEPAQAPSPLQMFQQPLEAKQERQEETLKLRRDAVSVKTARRAAYAYSDKTSALDKKLKDADAEASADEAVGGVSSVSPAAAAFGGRAAFNEPRPAALSGMISAKKEAAPVPPPPFLAEGRGESSGITRFETAAVRTAADWKALWARHAPGVPAPALDFSRVTVLAVFAGEKPTGGYAVQITQILPQGSGLRVTYRVTPPPPGAFVSQALTSPFHWAAVPREDGKIKFTPK